MNDFLLSAQRIVGHDNVLTEDLAAYSSDWRHKFIGAPLAVIRPRDTSEVSQIVALCAEYRIGIVPQGGNTGMCGGAVPDSSGRQIVLSLSRMNGVRTIDPLNNTMTVEAGCVLQTLQETAAAHDRLFPLSLGAEGSCQIGGNIATNAGGVQVLRYGNTRDLLLGLEVVLANGQVLDIMRALRKDNAGYDLKQLFVGSEGTLGIITAAVVKLFPKPKAIVTSFAALPSPDHAVRLLAHMRGALGERFTAFELISERCVQLVAQYFAEYRSPFTDAHPWFVLMQASDEGSQAALENACQEALEQALAQELLSDVVVASSDAQAEKLWWMREVIPEAQQRDGANIKHDISVPVSRIPEFIDQTVALLNANYEHARPIIFGHIGDGNLHYNVSHPLDWPVDVWLRESESVSELILGQVKAFNGSFSAEHGLGQSKTQEMLRYKNPAEIAVMWQIKHALDPQGLMNPGKTLPAQASRFVSAVS